MNNLITTRKVIRQGKGLAPALAARAPALPLSWEQRAQPNFVTQDARGARVDVRLGEEASPLHEADILVAEDGSLIRVVAATQPLLRLSAQDPAAQGMDLVQAAYQLGQRGIAASLEGMQLVVQDGAVVRALAQRLNLTATACDAAFEPQEVIPLRKYVALMPSHAPTSPLTRPPRQQAPVPHTAALSSLQFTP